MGCHYQLAITCHIAGDEAVQLAMADYGIAHIDHTVSRRVFWSKSWDSPWWRGPLVLIGIRGGDENCNRTVGLRLPRGALFFCLNVPLRQKPCADCQGMM